MQSQIVTANRLKDGIVVYFTSDDTWSHWIGEAHISHNDTDAQATLSLALASVASNEALDAYLIDVLTEAGTIKPVRYREIIRAKGPSINIGNMNNIGKTSIPVGAVTNSISSPQAFLNGV